ncbi:phage protein NinX family protein [Cronobacter sakazakii]
MTDYSKLSDGEISVRLAYFLKPKYSAVISQIDETGAQLSWNWFNTVQTTGYFPLRRAEDLFAVLKKHKICISPAGKTVWRASHESGVSATHRNPLRAVAIVFLLMQESQHA